MQHLPDGISSVIIYHKDHALVLSHKHLKVADATIQFCEILQCCEQQLVFNTVKEWFDTVRRLEVEVGCVGGELTAG